MKDYGWFFDNSALADGDPGYHQVGQKKPNPWGLYDMHGNVAEMVVDQYEADWYKKAAAKGNGKPVDWKDACRWPDSQYPRLVRGGSWNQDADELRSATRTKVTVAQNVTDPQLPKSPHWYSDGFWIGFRVVSPAVEPTAEEKAKWWEADSETVREVIKRDREIRGIPTQGDK